MGYTMTLLMLLFLTNTMLYFYGIDIPIVTWMNNGLGGQRVNDIGTDIRNANRTSEGGFSSSNMIWQIVVLIGLAALLAAGVSIAVGVVSSNYSVMYTVPLAMFIVLGALIITPMGSLVNGQHNIANDTYCYTMQENFKMFNETSTSTEPLTACLPSQVHILMLIFFCLLTIGTVMSFVPGRDF